MKKLLAASALITAMSAIATADEVIMDDLIANSSLCVGFDCIDGEVFGFDTIRLKENNTRIRFEDTSSAGNFPATDWQLTANDSANGGRNRFSIEDDTNGLESFTIMGGAPDFSIFVQENGDVGLGTDSPARKVHLVSDNEPAVRLEQSSEGGFPAATWDISVNEAGLSIALDGTPLLGLDSGGNLTLAGAVTSSNPGGPFPDYVFEADYALMPLDELERFVESNRHLPGIPSASDVEREGLNMTEMQVRLLEKVEELTLYTMQQQARIEALEAELRAHR